MVVRTVSVRIGVARMAFIYITNVQMLWFSLLLLVGCWIAVIGRPGAGRADVALPSRRVCGRAAAVVEGAGPVGADRRWGPDTGATGPRPVHRVWRHGSAAAELVPAPPRVWRDSGRAGAAGGRAAGAGRRGRGRGAGPGPHGPALDPGRDPVAGY